MVGQTVATPIDPAVLTNGLQASLPYVPYGDIAGVARDDAGNPVAGAIISTYLSTGFGLQALSRADGSFDLFVPPSGAALSGTELTPAGPYSVYGLAKAGYVTPQPIASVAVQPGQTTDITTTPVTYVRFGVIAGHVYDESGVLPIGGVKQKVLAARRSRLKEVILPKRNEPDLDDLPKDVRDEMTFHLVGDVREVLDIALEPAAQPVTVQVL